MNIVVKYRCPECDAVHSREYSAETCCPREADPVYICPQCDEQHESEEDAVECCEGVEPEPPTSAEIEALGQQRLDGL